MEIFRLKTLRVKDNVIFKKEITFNFSQESDSFSFEAPYITLILGANGTGKSNLLKFLIEVFRLAYDKQTEAENIYYPNGKYYLEYVLGNDNYTILNTLGWEGVNEKQNNIEDDRGEKGIRFWKNGSEIPATKIKIPESILALSIMLTDKYLFLRNPESYPIYKYLGVRRDNNTAGTRSFIGKTIDHIFAASGNKEFLESLGETLSFLELGNEFHISYSPRYKQHFFIPDLTVKKFEDFFLDYKKHLPRRKTEPWSVASFKHLKETEPQIIPKLVELLKHLSGQLENYGSSRAQYFEFNIFDIKPSLQKLFPLLPYLHRLNIISYPEITLKKDRHYGISESSSGEYHFISTIVGLLATITDKSLILIDEPEISLHPNWQMKYVAFLNKVFKKYNSAHFIICSHSHFLVSDIKPENSAIISLKKENETTATSISANTFGWSAEEVLYSVFNVRTVRNYFLEHDLTNLLGLIGQNSKDKKEIRKLIQRIEQMPVSDNDPLKEIIVEAKNFLDSND
ncbi:MAG: AAA family ATPase [Pedobacter sp.]|jgi:predicted ATPase|uniref:AAA family ATPase n=1 Tax=Pedobacter sp. TaxID=1411316 RepID=UPI003562AEA0